MISCLDTVTGSDFINFSTAPQLLWVLSKPSMWEGIPNLLRKKG